MFDNKFDLVNILMMISNEQINGINKTIQKRKKESLTKKKKNRDTSNERTLKFMINEYAVNSFVRVYYMMLQIKQKTSRNVGKHEKNQVKKLTG